ncbi:MAG: SIR2 family protein [Oscillospiraceae bacterium]|jgi:hypothetical protein|nr:SIR2 family protein [Oscillospiraceae bacterium]
MLDLNDPKFKPFGNLSTLRDITDLIKNNRIIPFVGAGMSIDIYGSWDSALRRIMDGHIFGQDAEDVQKLIDNGCYEDAAESISESLGETSFQDQVVAVFGETAITDETLGKMPVRYLPRLFQNSLVVTTNFDKVLEHAFLKEQYSFEEKVVLSHLSGWQAERSQKGSLHYLIKIHGCVSAPDEVVMTKTSYSKLYREGSQPIARLRSILGGNKLLFIGCGLKEDRTVDLLREVGLGGHYAILEMNAEAGETAFKKRKLLMSNELKMHCIWYPKGEHHYVEDILEYICADITGQLKADESAMFGDSRASGKQPRSVSQSDSIVKPSGSPHTKSNQSQTETKKPAPTPQPIAKPLIKNETYSIGRLDGKPLKWLILDVQPDRALLIAKDCLLMAPYNEKPTDVTWEDCSLRKKTLPGLLERIFDNTERSRVLLSKNQNPNNDNWGTPGGADTDDKLFLLSIDEAKRYFPYDKARIARLNGDTVWWWLRSPGYLGSRAAIVSLDGSVSDSGYYVSFSEGAVRPAFWLNLKS